jgi:hypothetical protein
MKKAFEMPVMTISVFSVEDIITESGANTTTGASLANSALQDSGVSPSYVFEMTLSDD